MKKLTLLSLVAATVLFTACGEKTKETVTDAATAVTDTASNLASGAVDSAKEAAANVVDTAKAKAAEVAAAAKVEAEKVAAAKEAATKKAADAAQALKDRAAATTAAVKETVTDAKEAVTTAVDNAAGKAAYAKCAGCHGVNGKTKALGKSAVVAGQPAADLEAAIAGYKAGTRNVAGMGMLMKGQVASMSEGDIKAVAAYMSGL